MEIFIFGDRLLSELQDEFQASYPYLKMVFSWKRGSDNKHEVLPDTRESYITLAEISRKNLKGFITIEDHTILNQLMKLFESEFDLSVSFLHFTESDWISANDVAEATLGELNEQGRISFHRVHNVAVKPDHLL